MRLLNDWLAWVALQYGFIFVHCFVSQTLFVRQCASGTDSIHITTA
jgi:hypothetical protein